MGIPEYKQISTETVESLVPILDEEGFETGEFETVRKEVPVMGMVYRDATPEEEAEAARRAELPPPPPTLDERVEMMEDAFAELCEVMFNG